MKPRAFLICAGLYAALCVALGALVDRNLYLGLVVLAVARPLLREVGLLADRDERQRVVSYRSSHVAFLVAMLIAGVIFVKAGVIDDREPPIEVSLILFLSLFAKFASLMIHGRARRTAGLAIAWVMGAAWLAFTLVAHGLSLMSLIEAVPWIAIFAAAVIGARRPRIGGWALLVIGIATLYVFVLAAGTTAMQKFIVAALVPFPLILAGGLLLAGDREWQEEGRSV
jgi:hypothetical protein